MKQATLAIMIITVLSKVLGFAREMALSYVYGASSVADAYLISQTIPTVVFSFVSAGIATGFIPMYSRILSVNGRSEADRYTSNLSNALLLLAATIAFFVLALTQPIVRSLLQDSLVRPGACREIDPHQRFWLVLHRHSKYVYRLFTAA